jgi:hypothetical protein
MSIASIFRAAAGLIAVAALIVQYWLLVRTFDGDIGAATLRFLNYFTLLSNVVGAAAFLFPALAPGSAAGRYFSRPAVRTAATLYLVVVGVVYHALLASRWDPKGWQLAADVALHTITPVAIVIDWLFLTGKRDLSMAYVPRAVLFPLVFAVWVLILGAVSGFYPYPFLDVAALGYPRVLTNLAILLALFAILGALMAMLGRRIAQSAAAQK